MVKATKKSPLVTRDFRRWLVASLDTEIACALAGASMALCFAPFYLWWLCWLLPLPLFIACQHPNPAVRVRRGALFGIMYFGLGSYWFAQTLILQLGFSWVTGIAGHLVIAGACALAPTIFCWLAGYMRHAARLWPLLLPMLWVVIEDVRFQAFGGGPWMSFGLSQIDSPLAGYLPIVGEIGTSGVVCVLSYLLLTLLAKGTRTAKLTTLLLPSSALVGIIVGGYWLTQIDWTQQSGAALPFAMVQTATSQHEKVKPELQQNRLEQLSALSRPYFGKAALVIWPETVVTLERKQIVSALQHLTETMQSSNSTILMGAFEASLNRHMFNTAFTFGYEGGQTYRKRHLVPFGESVPFLLSFMDAHVPGDQMRGLGKIPELIAIRGQLLGISICWEGAFSRDITPLVRSGAGILVNVANEAWFAGSPLPQQNLDAMRVRAWETGRPAVRVANFGPGAIIDEKGRILTALPATVPGSAIGSITPRSGSTPYMRLGSDFVLFFSFAIVIVIAFVAFKGRRV